MNHRTEIPPEISRTEVGLVVVTVRHTGDAAGERAAAASLRRGDESWPDGLLSWTLFIATDGQALMAYEQWTGDAALDVALASAPPYVPGVPGTEQSAPVRYRLHRPHAIAVEKIPVGCVVTPVFDVDGPERQRHLVDKILALTQGGAPSARRDRRALPRRHRRHPGVQLRGVDGRAVPPGRIHRSRPARCPAPRHRRDPGHPALRLPPPAPAHRSGRRREWR
ncbi:hypothetical protein [Streptomyces sp. URMC 125]|uniref:hypothetical protein n=1 Tax=Streptomyces sp. URMC 125 TaxID=3423419 RepID=UPI003F1B3644